METQHVIKHVLSIFIILFSIGINSQELDSDHFTLYKGGEKIKKKDVYLMYDNNFKKNIHAKQETYVYKRKIVLVKTERKCQKSKNLKYTNTENLFDLEKKVIEKEILKTEKEKGFKPVFPLTHIALKVHLIKDDECFVVDWIRR